MPTTSLDIWADKSEEGQVILGMVCRVILIEENWSRKSKTEVTFRKSEEFKD